MRLFYTTYMISVWCRSVWNAL